MQNKELSSEVVRLKDELEEQRECYQQVMKQKDKLIRDLLTSQQVELDSRDREIEMLKRQLSAKTMETLLLSSELTQGEKGADEI